METKTKLLIALVLIVALLLGLFLFANRGNCSILESQQKILSSDVPLNATERSEMMREVEKDMRFIDYLCLENPQQLLIKRFGLVPLEEK